MSKPARMPRSAARRKSAITASHVGTRHLARHLAVREVRQRRCRDQRPAALRQRLVDALPHQLGRALAARMAELQAEFRRRVGVHEIDDALPRRLVRVGVEAGAAVGDARERRHAHHLGEDQPGAADRAAAEMHEMPVGRRAVDRRVLVHRRDHHPVGELHAAQAERLEHRHRGLAQRRRRSPCWRTSCATRRSISSTIAGARRRRLS